MKNTIIPGLLCSLCFGFNAFAQVAEEPLPDYVARFNEADALIRGIDSTITGADYCQWVEQAIGAKNKLELRNDINPWLEGLAENHPDNWRILHTAAHGMVFHGYRNRDERRWQAIQLMDRAYTLLREENPPTDETAGFLGDFITILTCAGNPDLLQLQTLGSSYEEWGEERNALAEQYQDNPAANLMFFDLPASYEAAANDGERVRRLLHEHPPTGKRDMILPDFAVLTVGAHINVPLQRRPHLDNYDSEPPPSVRTVLSELKDHETVDWGRSNEYRIVELPEDYRYIAAFEQLAAQGDKGAAHTLGNIFVNRCQLERAAQWFEKAGSTNEYRDIRANQGIFLPHGTHISGKPISIDFFFRNGSEVEFALFPLNAGSNLLSRLITKQVRGTEVELLQGEPNNLMRLHGTDYAGLPGDRPHHWTLPLSPLPDHRDAVQAIHIPELERGNYLLRASLKDGNRSETILHVYDTVLYQLLHYDPESHNLRYNIDDSFNILCDARTGQPCSNREMHLCDLSGGVRRLKEKENNPSDLFGDGEEMFLNGSAVDSNDLRDDWHMLEHYIRRFTDSDGLFNSDDIPSHWEAIDITPHQTPFATGHQTPFVSEAGAYALKLYNPRDVREDWKDEFCAFITPDRPVYRPGETGHIKLWLRNGHRWRYAPSLEIESQRTSEQLPVEINPALKDGEGQLIDEFGGADYTFTIPENAALGGYRCSNGRNRYGYRCDFRVEEYRAPEFRLNTRLANEGSIEIAADYTYGKPLGSGSVTGSLNFEESHTHWFYPPAPLDAAWGKGYWWNGAQFSRKPADSTDDDLYCYATFTNSLDETGRSWIDLSSVSNAMPALERPGYFELSMNATDPAGKQYHDWQIVPTASARGPEFCCWLDSAFYSITNTITCHTANTSASTNLQLEISTLDSSSPFQHIPLTQESVTLPSLPAGIYSVRLLNESGAASQPFEFAVIDDTTPVHVDLDRKTTDLTEDNPLRIVVEKGLYHSNDIARLLIQVDRPGRYVYWFPRAIDGLGFNRPEVFQMETVSKIVELPLNQELDKGIIQSAAFTIVDGRPHTANANITIKTPELDAGTIGLTPGKQAYKPGEEVSLNIQTLDSSGEGRRCSVTLTVYNKSLDLWADANPPRIVDALFSRWRNCANQIIETRSPYAPLIQALHPKWVMESILPCGNAPVFTGFGFYEISSMSCFGCAESLDESDPLAEEDANPEPRIREDFRDLAYWNATIITDSNGLANVSFPMPDGLVEWKIKAWAMHTNYAAEAETSIRCAKDFIANLNTPRFMVEGDEIELSTSIRNHTTNAVKCTADCSIDGGPLAQQTIDSLPAGKEILCYWTTQAQKTGNADITTTVISDTDSDGMKRSLPVHPHGLLKRGGHGGVLAGNQLTETVEIIIPEAIDPASLDFRLHATPDMLEALAGALPYLAEYPHGCTEQTLNRFLPSLTVMQTMQELGMDSLIANTSMPPDREAVIDPAEIRKRAQAGIDRLEDAHKHSRGWGWNMDDDSPRDPLISAWVLRGLHAASQVSGLHVQESVIDDMRRYLLNEMDDDLEVEANPTNSVAIYNTDAFLSLALIEAGIEKVHRWNTERNEKFTDEENQTTLQAYMALLFSRADELSLYGKILLANAYDLQENIEERDQLVAFVEQYLEHDSKTGRYWLRTHSDEWWWWYNDDIELHAWYLKLLNRIDPHGAKTAGVARYLMQNRIYGDHWKSTRDTAICIEALSVFAKNNRADSPEANIRISLNGEELGNSEKAQLIPGTNTLMITSANGTPVFFDAAWQYYSKEDPITPECCDLVAITRSYSRICEETNIVIQPQEQIKTGETIEVKLTITANQPLEYLLVEDRKPAGFETIGTKSGYYRGSFREFHDERVSYYLTRIPKGESVLSYRMRAEHAGTVSALPATVELMYEPRQAANAAERRIRIVRKP